MRRIHRQSKNRNTGRDAHLGGQACATRKIGEITSGTQSPSLGVGSGMGYVTAGAATPGAQIDIEIRGKKYTAVIEKPPLLKKNA